jgi:guanylate kinase
MKRKTEEKKALEERLKKARDEIVEARWYDYLILNNELERAQEQLQAIILAEHCRRERMAEALERLLLEK